MRECIGCNVCISKSETGHHLGCTQNATAGEEYRRGWHPERFEQAANADRDVLVVGAGAAGMECAIVLGKRGLRRVHLVDAEPEIGGVMRWIPTLPGLGEWARVVNWRRIQLEKLKNVEVVTGVAAGRSRRARVRGGDRHRGDGRALVGERPERPHARAAAGRGRDPAPRAHPGAGHGRGQAAARGAAGGLRRRGVLHGCRGSPSSSRRRAAHVELADTARADRACLRRDSRRPAAARTAPRRRRLHAPRRDARQVDPRGRSRRGRVRRPLRARGGRHRARHAAPLEREPLPRAGVRPRAGSTPRESRRSTASATACHRG